VLNPTNCDTADVVITVVAAPIVAVDDSYSSINGYTGSTTASVLGNDTLNGVVVNPSEIIVTPVTVPSGFTLNADGTISIASGISAGTYTVTYSICEVLNPTNCDTADVVITVVAAPIVAVDDSYSSINGYTGSTTASVLGNDTLNGVVVNPSEIIVTPVTVPSGFTLNADGTISIASGISAGTYTVTYSICEVLNPTNCDTADVCYYSSCSADSCRR
jgi:large repetitive protein